MNFLALDLHGPIYFQISIILARADDRVESNQMKSQIMATVVLHNYVFKKMGIFWKMGIFSNLKLIL